MAQTKFPLKDMLRKCVDGDSEGWEAFIRCYGAVGQIHIGQYFPSLESETEKILQEIFVKFKSNDCELIKSFSGTFDAEFLMTFKEVLYSLCYGKLKDQPDRNEGLENSRQLTKDEAIELFKGIRLLHQKVLFMLLKGFPQQQIAEALIISPESLRDSLTKYRTNFDNVLGSEFDIDHLPKLNHETLQQIDEDKGERCYEVNTFVIDMRGQITWKEKQKLDLHIAECLRCLNRATSVKELVFYQRTLPPLDHTITEHFSNAIGIVLVKELARRSAFSKLVHAFGSSKSS